jgi:folate-binding protein YgfZ
VSERRVIAVAGGDREGFLQNLVTNDVGRARGGLAYAALLTPQGKYLADFLLKGEEDRILIDVAAPLAPALLQRLSMYRLRADVALTPLDMGVARGTGPAPEGALADPRHPALGWRLYGGTGDDGTDWDAVRVAQVVPESGVELHPDTFILEAGFERLHGVDFRKGCYVGQEVTARMKHKTELRKGLVGVLVEGVAPVGTPILMPDGREAGTLYTQSGGRGIAYLRFDRAAGPLAAGAAAVRLGEEGEAAGDRLPGGL